MSNADNKNSAIPTVNLIQEYPDILKENSEAATGHCTKCHALLRFLHAHYGTRSPDESQRRKFFVVVDDDTMMSIPRLLELLTWYNFDDGSRAASKVRDGGGIFSKAENAMEHQARKAAETESLATASPLPPAELGEWYIGEHYAQGYQCGVAGGSDFITMGGGMVMSAPLLERVIERCEDCVCYRANDADDMRVGSWISAFLALPLSHEDAFHQARSDSYDPDVKRGQYPVSFHKFSNFQEDNTTVYNKAEVLARFQEDFGIMGAVQPLTY